MSVESGRGIERNSTSIPPTCLALHIGLWGEARRGVNGALLYRDVLKVAKARDIQGATVWNSIEGVNPNRRFLSVENEVASNDLPVWITLMDSPEHIRAFVPLVVERVRGNGVMCAEPVRWVSAARFERGSEDVKPPDGQQGIHVQVFMLESAKVQGKPVYQAVAELLRHHGVRWVSTTRGLVGYGEGRKIRGRRWFGVPDDVPITMHVVDEAETLRPLVPMLVELVDRHALVIATDVSIHA